MLQAVIFDMDGVIVDSEPLHILAEIDTFAPFGVKIVEEELQAYMGRTSRMLISDFIDKYALDTTLKDLYPIHKINLEKRYRYEAEAFPGVLDLIHAIKDAGLPLGLASSTDRDFIQVVIEKLDLKSVFGAMVSGEEVERIKPEPDIFLKAADLLGVNPAGCVVIEDSRAGVTAAKSAGMRVIGFQSPHSLHQDISPADRIVDDLQTLTLDELRQMF